MSRSDSPAGEAESLTHAFYEWESWGRGWLQAPEPVELEPPLSFPSWHQRGPQPRDDTRVESWFKRLLRLGANSSPEPEPAAAEAVVLRPERYNPVLIESELLPEVGTRFSRAHSLSWLSALASLDSPIAFEILRLDGESTVRLAHDPAENALVSSSLRALTTGLHLSPAEGLRDRWLRTVGDDESGLVIAGFEFALAREFLFTLSVDGPGVIDGLLASLDELEPHEVGLWQVLGEPVSQNWQELIPFAGLGPRWQSVLEDLPELPDIATEKARATPHYSVAVRLLLAVERPERAFELASAVSGALRTLSGSNALVPLSDTDVEALQRDVLRRASRRLGMILTASELSGLVGLPQVAGNSSGLRLWRDRPQIPADRDGLLIGEGEGSRVLRLTTAERLRHTHVIGATGSGKSNLLLSMIEQDLRSDQGLCVVDPHGDLADQVLARVPEERWDQVVLLDPSRNAQVIGWNALDAWHEAEREILASDMVSVFQRLSTSWGDQMTTVLSNAVLALLDVPEAHTLLELKRFLSEQDFREQIVSRLTDQYVRSFWINEWPGLKAKRAAVPILTRLDGLLRQRRVRETLCVREGGLDFRSVLDRSGIIVARFAGGEIGEANASLLGSLLITRLYQAALSRSLVPHGERQAFFLYADEFQEVATPSMRTLFSAGRKYGLGLTVAHHDFRQLRRAGEDLEHSLLTNTHTRISFRVGAEDARRLERGLAHYASEDLTSLSIGTCVVRLGRDELDFRLKTGLVKALEPSVERERIERVRAVSQRRFGVDRSSTALPAMTSPPSPEPTPTADTDTKGVASSPATSSTVVSPALAAAPEPEVATEPDPHPEGRGGPEHRYLQSLVRSWAQERGFRAELEFELEAGGRVDLVITPEDTAGDAPERIAVEISVTTGLEHELENARKCLAAGFDHVALLSPQASFRASLQREIGSLDAAAGQLAVYAPDEFLSWLQALPRSRTRVAGYLVRTQTSAEASVDERRARLNQVIAGSLARLRREDSD